MLHKRKGNVFVPQRIASRMGEDAYIILSKINEGAFGGIYSVHSIVDKKIYAMKQILFHGDISCDAYIKYEIEHLSTLKHENIIKLRDIIIREYSVNLIMEFAENGSLENHILENQPTFRDIYVIFQQIVTAVDFCHLNRIAHRDITPCNILLTSKTIVRLADFGLSVPCRDSEGHVILCDDYMGHLHYSAPEVLKKTPYDPLLSDMWSVGVVLYFMVYARVPFVGDEEFILSQEIDDSVIASKILENVEQMNDNTGLFNIIIRNLLTTEPQNRLQTDKVMQFIKNEA